MWMTIQTQIKSKLNNLKAGVTQLDSHQLYALDMSILAWVFTPSVNNPCEGTKVS